VSPERPRDRDVAHLAVLDEVGHFFGDRTTALTDTFVKKILMRREVLNPSAIRSHRMRARMRSL
jgi:hypothetical protein